MTTRENLLGDGASPAGNENTTVSVRPDVGPDGTDISLWFAEAVSEEDQTVHVIAQGATPEEAWARLAAKLAEALYRRGGNVE